VSEQSVESMWIDEMIEKGLTADQLIEQLKKEREEAKGTEHENEENEFLSYSIELLERMKHA